MGLAYKVNDFLIPSHSTLRLSKVNTYGLMYVWEGFDASIKPVLLAAHQGIPV
jgi:Gly-Xaa carboxypeptidase